MKASPDNLKKIANGRWMPTKLDQGSWRSVVSYSWQVFKLLALKFIQTFSEHDFFSHFLISKITFE